MPGLCVRLALALALPLTAASGCTMSNPLFEVTTASTEGATGTTGAASMTGPVSGPGTSDTSVTTLEPTTSGSSGEPGTTTATSASTTDGPAGFCGDGTIDPGELCDDGDQNGPGMPCGSDCTTPGCGDGVVEGAEQCDDGNDINEDDCLNTCVFAICGDQVKALSEQCDDGNLDNNDACTNACVFNVCGDGILNNDAEECDDGDLVSGDGCSEICTEEYCGDGIVQLDFEDCDDGNDNDNDDCTNDCFVAECGDGIVHFGVEQCDDGNNINTDTCKTDCTQGPCGDAIYDPNTEQCDFSAPPFKGHDGLCSSDTCTINTCFKLTNTEGEDFINNPEWFKPCVDTDGGRVHIVVLNSNKQIVYVASGDKGDWSYDSITSSFGPTEQYNLAKHIPIVLDNGDRMMVTGTSSMPGLPSCIKSLGDGYGLVILPPIGDGLKVLLMPYKGKSGNPRLFTNWSATQELSFNMAGMPLCVLPGPTAALNWTVLIAISD